MEDTLVKPGMYAYQFRVDIPHNSGLKTVMVFMKHYAVKFYIIGAETSEAKKEHFQCILWFETKITATKLRNWWKGKTSKTKQPVSLTSAKKIKSLAKYTMKENKFTTNLTPEEVNSIGKWSQKLKKIQWAEALDEHAKKFDKTEVETFEQKTYDTWKHNPDAVSHAFISYLLDYYKINQKRPSRASLQYLAWKHGYMSNYSLIQQWF